jgi:hypothetical protein
MIALRVDVADAVVEVTVMPHERAAIVTVETGGAHDAYLDAHDLRDLARVATIAADELDRVARVGS